MLGEEFMGILSCLGYLINKLKSTALVIKIDLHQSFILTNKALLFFTEAIKKTNHCVMDPLHPSLDTGDLTS